MGELVKHEAPIDHMHSKTLEGKSAKLSFLSSIITQLARLARLNLNLFFQPPGQTAGDFHAAVRIPPNPIISTALEIGFGLVLSP